jgi:rod shape-determining protein MreD
MEMILMLKKAILITLFCFFGLFIQSSVIHSNFPGFIAPDFILLVVVIIGLQSPGVGGLFVSFLLGLFADVASGVYLGPQAAGCVIAFCLTIGIAKRVFAEQSFAVASICFWASLAKTSTYLLLLMFYVSPELLTRGSLTILLLEALLTALVAPVFYKMFISKKTRNSRGNNSNPKRSVAYSKGNR